LNILGECKALGPASRSCEQFAFALDLDRTRAYLFCELFALSPS
jgi:hypothetical protein